MTHRTTPPLVLALFLLASSAEPQTMELAKYTTSGGYQAYATSRDVNLSDPKALGSGNRYPEVGEAFTLFVNFRNTGPGDIEMLTASARVSEGAAAWARVIGGPVEYGRLKAGENVRERAFRLEVLPDAPAPCLLPLEFQLTADGKPASPEVLRLEIPVFRPPVFSIEVEKPDTIEPGKTAIVRLVAKPDPPELDLIYVSAHVLDFDLKVTGSLSIDLKKPKDRTFEFAVRSTPVVSSASVRLGVFSHDKSGPCYESELTLTFPIRPAGPQAMLELAGAPGLDPAGVFVEQFGYPPLTPGATRPAGPFRAKLAVSKRSYSVVIEVHGPPESPPPPFAVVLGDWPGTPLAEGASVTPDDRPLTFGWTGPPPAGWNLWVRVREDAVVFQLHRAPPGMIHIRAGAFEINRRRQGISRIVPGRKITLSAFCLDAFEVTRGPYAAFLQGPKSRSHELCDPAEGPGKDHTPLGWDPATLDTEREAPVTGVDWYDAFAFARWIGKRLPTAAEWERVATGPSQRPYPWGDEYLSNLCIIRKCRPGPIRVGHAFTDRSEEGAWDMGGNASEWVGDWFRRDYWNEGPDQDPRGPDSGEERIFRGGAFLLNEDASSALSGRRLTPRERENFIGFRCAKDADR